MNAVEREWEFEGAKVCDGCDPEGNVFQIRAGGLNSLTSAELPR